ncbi:MAG: ribose-5-phosphate isomerase RpiA [Planctomycetes bacterium]|nr:ribose-5-phosphate isomerase RpiA [Planctomycetota bacterium]
MAADISERALELIPDGAIVGLGTGKASTAFIHALGAKVKAGLRVRGIPTSQVSADLATKLGIPLTNFAEVESIDVAVDGADEVDPQCNLIKGYGGALLREKVVAAAAKQFVVLVGDEKEVAVLGSRGKLPVEVVPFALDTARRRLTALGCIPVLRTADGKTFITDNGNYLLDCKIAPLVKPREMELAIQDIPGVAGTGLFLGMADVVLIQKGDKIEERRRSR